MINPHSDSILQLRRIERRMLVTPAEREGDLRERHVESILTFTNLSGYRLFWGMLEDREADVPQACATLRDVAIELKTPLFGQLLDTPYDKICAASAMTEEAMALLLDFVVFKGLRLNGAPADTNAEATPSEFDEAAE